jgi:hypothetical protein
VLECPGNLILPVHFARTEAIEEILNRQVEVYYLVGLPEEGVWYGLADSDTGRLLDKVVETLQVLHVKRADDIDASIKEFKDILITLLMSAPRNIRVGEFIDNCNLGSPPQYRVEVHLLHDNPSVLEAAPWNNLKSLNESCSFSTTMRLDKGQYYINAALFEGVGFL